MYMATAVGGRGRSIHFNLFCDAAGATQGEDVGRDRADLAVVATQERRRRARMAAIAMITEGHLACCYRNTHRGAHDLRRQWAEWGQGRRGAQTSAGRGA